MSKATVNNTATLPAPFAQTVKVLVPRIKVFIDLCWTSFKNTKIKILNLIHLIALMKIIFYIISWSMYFNQWFNLFLFSGLKIYNRDSLFSTIWISTIIIKHHIQIHYKGHYSSQTFCNKSVGVWFLFMKYNFG